MTASATPPFASDGATAPIHSRRGGECAPGPPFWKTLTLEQMSHSQWESLCDGCGRCCLIKLEDEDTGEIHFTDVACRLFSAERCACSDYANRRRRVRDCIILTPAKVRELTWLPPSCAYRLVAEGRDLAWWHPLVSGSPDSVHEAGVSVRGRVKALERQVRLRDYPDHIVKWAAQMPRPRKPRLTSKSAQTIASRPVEPGGVPGGAAKSPIA